MAFNFHSFYSDTVGVNPMKLPAFCRLGGGVSRQQKDIDRIGEFIELIMINSDSYFSFQDDFAQKMSG